MITRIQGFLFRLRHWETWNYLAKYIPIMPVWLWYCIRARSFWFFSSSNPTLTFGGFEGESKQEMFDQLPDRYYPATIYVSPGQQFENVSAMMQHSAMQYPVAVKPDVGMMGFMFRKVDSEAMLRKYHSIIPVRYIIQDYVDYPIEVSVFYYRLPGEKRGTITGFIKKEFLTVKGNGVSTLGELIAAYPRARFRIDELKARHARRLNDVIGAEESYCLCNALNLSRGGRLISLAHEKDDSLLKVFDDLSHYTGQFYYGRYDIKCASIDDLKAGKKFFILEFNGCGAEPHHIYGNGNSLLTAYKIVLQHWKMLYKISSHNHRHGVAYWRFRKGWSFLRNAKKHFKMLKQLDTATEL